jgi:hypothetical protein
MNADKPVNKLGITGGKATWIESKRRGIVGYDILELEG